MRKHSKRNHRRMHQSGLGSGLSVVASRPRPGRQLPDPPTLARDTEDRLHCVEYANQHGVVAAVPVFAHSRATTSRWCKRYDPANLRSLKSRSRRPKRTRHRQWTAAQEQAVLKLRIQYPRYGKAKLHHLLRSQGTELSESMIGRMLHSLKRRRLLIEPHGVRTRREGAARPYATRVPKDKRSLATPGELIQLDTMHLRPLPGVERRQFTAIDVVSRVAVLGVRSQATAGTAAARLEDLIARLPVDIQAIQVDGGSAFMADFEAACEAKGIALSVLPRAHPSSMAASNGSTAPCAASSGSVTTGISICQRSTTPCATSRICTLPSDHTRHSSMPPPPPA